MDILKHNADGNIGNFFQKVFVSDYKKEQQLLSTAQKQSNLQFNSQLQNYMSQSSSQNTNDNLFLYGMVGASFIVAIVIVLIVKKKK